MINLLSLGWNNYFAKRFAALPQEGVLLARVDLHKKHRYNL